MTVLYALVTGIAVGWLLSEGSIVLLAWTDRRRGEDPHWADDDLGEYEAAARERGGR